MSEEVKLLIEGAGFLVTLAVIVWRLSAATTKFEIIGKQQATEITEIKKAVEKIDVVMTAVAVQNTRLDNIDQRQIKNEKMIEEMKHGEGFIGFDIKKLLLP